MNRRPDSAFIAGLEVEEKSGTTDIQECEIFISCQEWIGQNNLLHYSI